MKFESTHIGGIEPGPVTLRYPNGNEGECQRYIYRGRQLLGELKQRMQIGGIGAAWQDLTLPDGVKLHAQSNMIGLADIDEIWIDKRASAMTAESYRLIGFIGRSFIFGDAGNYWTYWIIKHAGETILIQPAIEPDFDPRTFAGYPDNGAKYLYSYNTGNTLVACSHYGISGSDEYNDNILENAPASYGLVGKAYWPAKEPNNQGMVGRSGFDVSTYTLHAIYPNGTDAFNQYGSGFVFMMPQDGSIRFSWGDEVIAYQGSGTFNMGRQQYGYGDFGVPIEVPNGVYSLTLSFKTGIIAFTSESSVVFTLGFEQASTGDIVTADVTLFPGIIPPATKLAFPFYFDIEVGAVISTLDDADTLVIQTNGS